MTYRLEVAEQLDTLVKTLVDTDLVKDETWRKQVHDLALTVMQLTDIDKPIWNVLLRRNAMPADSLAVRTLGYSITRMFNKPMPWYRCEQGIVLYQTGSWQRAYTYTIVTHTRAEELRMDWIKETGGAEHGAKENNDIASNRQTIRE